MLVTVAISFWGRMGLSEGERKGLTDVIYSEGASGEGVYEVRCLVRTCTQRR
jgi:hypothetical protein